MAQGKWQMWADNLKFALCHLPFENPFAPYFMPRQ
jgi:hypothetical protein